MSSPKAAVTQQPPPSSSRHQKVTPPQYSPSSREFVCLHRHHATVQPPWSAIFKPALRKKPTQQQKAPKPSCSTSAAKPPQDASATTCTSPTSTATNLREAQTRVTHFLHHLQPQPDLQDKT
ncbi:hypothetical protein V8G54_004369 [Vigna mungo]|uniref:Uncharacterized protein n=1 Tax=Vigna mungo TaxID=3915 RepID=A0AAQ3PE42_VIGMU